MRRAGLYFSVVLVAGACGSDDAPEAASRTACGGAALGIAEVQGAGPVSPELARSVTVEGRVTWVRAEADEPAGFFLQAIQPDGDPRTSEGLLVLLPAG